MKLKLALLVTYLFTMVLFVCGNPAIVYPLMWHHVPEVACIFLLGYWFYGYAKKKGKQLTLQVMFKAWVGMCLFTAVCLFTLIPEVEVFSGMFFAVSIITCPLLVGFWLASRRQTG